MLLLSTGRDFAFAVVDNGDPEVLVGGSETVSKVSKRCGVRG